jgi:hypothetical protein
MEVQERKQMKRIVMRAALASACAGLALPAGLATADETSDLRAEIAAQRAQIEAQRLRLEALEKKLDATAAAQQAAAQQAASQQAANQQGGSFREAFSNMWTSGPPQTAAERLVAAANDVGSGITFQVTPADSVTLYGLLDITLSTPSAMPTPKAVAKPVTRPHGSAATAGESPVDMPSGPRCPTSSSSWRANSFSIPVRWTLRGSCSTATRGSASKATSWAN